MQKSDFSTKRIIIQIYEIQEPSEAEMLVQMDVDHIGSVVLKEGRDEKIKEVVEICKKAGKKSSIIFLLKDMDEILREIDYYEPDIVHFCEEIGLPEKHIERQKEVKKRFPEVLVMRSIPVPVSGKKRIFDPEDLRSFDPYTDIYLIDTHVEDPPVKGYIGITGKTCDWNLAREIVKISSRPVILGGGLSPENVYDALCKVGPDGVDSCTGTNKRDKEGRPIRFKKDPERLRKFIEEVRRYEKEREAC